MKNKSIPCSQDVPVVISKYLSRPLIWLRTPFKNNRHSSDTLVQNFSCLFKRLLPGIQMLFYHEVSQKIYWNLPTAFPIQSTLMMLALQIVYWRTSIQALFFSKKLFNILFSHATLYLFIYCGALWVVGAQLHQWRAVQSNLQWDSSPWLSSAAAYYSLKDSLCQSMINNV